MTISPTFSRTLKTVGAFFFLMSVRGYAEQCYVTNTSLPVTISGCNFVGPLPGGSTSYIQNTSSLQTGATAYPDFVIVGTSLTLPNIANAVLGTNANGVVISTTISGGGGGTPGGSDTNAQYNTMGSFAGASYTDVTSSSWTFNTTNNAVNFLAPNSGANFVDGVFLQNLSPATSGTQQQFPPLIHMQGSSWNTSSTASKTMDWEIGGLAVAGPTATPGAMLFNASVPGLSLINIELCSLVSNAQAVMYPMDNNGCGFTAGGTGMGPVNAGNKFGAYSNGTLIETFQSAGHEFPSTALIGWSNAGLSSTFSPDTAIGRENTGILQVNTGTLGSLGNIHFSSVEISSGTVTLDGSGVPPNSQALCLLAGQLGHCTSAVGVSGGCTCSAP